MSSEACLSLLLDGPLQSWGHASRFERRTTALHPTRSGVIGLLSAALGFDKYAAGESEQLARFGSTKIIIVSLPRSGRSGERRLIRRLEDYHTVTGIRRASGKVDENATVQTYRHYLLDARFGVLVEGPTNLLEEAAAALRNPRWGVWLGRKCCPPASPVLVAGATRAEAWRELLKRTDHTGEELLEQFDHVIEVDPSEPGAEAIEDMPLGFGHPIGERHALRWIRRISQAATGSQTP